MIKFGAKSGVHDGFIEPLFSWIPGVGAGNLIRVQNNSPLQDWRGDLLVAQMGSEELHRLKLVGNKVVLDEKIVIGFRIRDLVISSQGILFTSSDEGLLSSYNTYDSKKVKSIIITE